MSDNFLSYLVTTRMSSNNPFEQIADHLLDPARKYYGGRSITFINPKSEPQKEREAQISIVPIRAKQIHRIIFYIHQPLIWLGAIIKIFSMLDSDVLEKHKIAYLSSRFLSGFKIDWNDKMFNLIMQFNTLPSPKDLRRFLFQQFVETNDQELRKNLFKIVQKCKLQSAKFPESNDLLLKTFNRSEEEFENKKILLTFKSFEKELYVNPRLICKESFLSCWEDRSEMKFDLSHFPKCVQDSKLLEDFFKAPYGQKLEITSDNYKAYCYLSKYFGFSIVKAQCLSWIYSNLDFLDFTDLLALTLNLEWYEFIALLPEIFDKQYGNDEEKIKKLETLLLNNLHGKSKQKTVLYHFIEKAFRNKKIDDLVTLFEDAFAHDPHLLDGAKFSKIARQMYHSSEYGDVTLEISYKGTKSAISVFAPFLQNQSEFMNILFDTSSGHEKIFKDWNENTRSLSLDRTPLEDNPNLFFSIIEFCYCGTIPEISLEEKCILLWASVYYQIPKLEEEMVSSILNEQECDWENYENLLYLCRATDSIQLCRVCCEWMIKQMLISDSFDELVKMVENERKKPITAQLKDSLESASSVNFLSKGLIALKQGIVKIKEAYFRNPLQRYELFPDFFMKYGTYVRELDLSDISADTLNKRIKIVLLAFPNEVVVKGPRNKITKRKQKTIF